MRRARFAGAAVAAAFVLVHGAFDLAAAQLAAWPPPGPPPAATAAGDGSRAFAGDWSHAPAALVQLSPDAHEGDRARDPTAGARAFAHALARAGGHVAVVFPPDAALVLAEDAALAAPEVLARMQSVHRAAADLVPLTGPAALALRLWNTMLPWRASLREAPFAGASPDASALHDRGAQGMPMPADPLAMPVPDAGPVPVPLGPPPAWAQKVGPHWPYGAQWYDTSEFLIGSVAVGVWLLEAAGSTYDWSSQEEDQTLAGIAAGLENWVRKGGAGAGLTFVLDIHTGVAVSGVPIQQPRESDASWMEEVLAVRGYPGANAFERCFAYNNQLRDAFQTQWCASLVVVDSDPAVNEGLFSGGGYAFAYYGGPWLYMSRFSTWAFNSEEYFGVVPMHEMGHIFFATDEYDGFPQYGGYLNERDTPSSLVTCIMNQNDSTTVCTPTRQQLGWRDIDHDDVHDIVDAPPLTQLVPHAPDPTWESTPTWTGVAQVATITNRNPLSRYQPPHPMTIATIALVEVRLDGGSWTPAQPIDGTFDAYVEGFAWTAPPLADGPHTVEARARTSWGTGGVIVSDVVQVDHTLVGGVDPPRNAAFRLLPVAPNPAGGPVTLRFVLPSACRVRVTVHDVAGALVRTVADAEHAAGVASAGWDGRDARGHRVPAGVYLARLEAGRHLAVRKLVMAR